MLPVRGLASPAADARRCSANLGDYLGAGHVAEAGFNYHLISVFGSQSTGKSTLLNHLFGTDFSVMSETERRQTTKGIWMAKNKRGPPMADNILVMDVEGTDGRERGEYQDFERKSALFALATSEVLIVNIWEHQVGLYQGANMGLLKTVFEVNLQLFLKDKQCVGPSAPPARLMTLTAQVQVHPALPPLLRHPRPSRYHAPVQPAHHPDPGPDQDLVHHRQAPGARGLPHRGLLRL